MTLNVGLKAIKTMNKVVETLEIAKKALKEARNLGVESLPDSVLIEFNSSIDKAQEEVTVCIQIVEKHYEDEVAQSLMKREVEDQIKESSLFKGVGESTKSAIAEKVISDSKTVLLNEETFRKYLQDTLYKLPNEQLVLKAYSKDDIIRIGSALTSADASDGTRYNVGLKSLEGMMMKPEGVDEAVSFGMERILKDPRAKEHYLLAYYGLN
jgi:inorganic triphosphatase YgiF